MRRRDINLPSNPGRTHSLDGVRLEPVLPHKQGEQSFNNFMKFLCVRSQGSRRSSANSQKMKHCLRQWSPASRSKASAFQICFAHLFNSVSQHSRVPESAARGLMALAGFCRDFRPVFSTTGRPQDHEAIRRPLRELRHFLADVFDSFWRWPACCALVFPEFEAVPLQRFSELGHDKWCTLGRRRHRDVIDIRTVFQFGRPTRPLAFSSLRRILPRPPSGPARRPPVPHTHPAGVRL